MQITYGFKKKYLKKNKHYLLLIMDKLAEEGEKRVLGT